MIVNKSLITNQVTGAGTGSVTSVAMTVPTGLTVSGSPITSAGTLSISFASGVALPPSQTGNAGKYLTTDGTNLSWGNISGSISGTANYMPFFATSSTLGTSPLYYDGSYYMAIGTTTTGTGRFLVYNNLADTHLQVSGTTPSIRITDTPTSATYNTVIGLAISANSFITNTVAGDLAIDNSTGGNIIFGISNSEKLRIFTSTGNVSINGTSTDTGDKLYVSGGIKATAQLKLTGYTSTSAYPGTAAGYLAFDSAGNILSAAAPSGGTPAGSNTQIQYNNSGVFGASSAFTYTDSSGLLYLRKDQNTGTYNYLSNYNTGSSAQAVFSCWTSATSVGSFGKVSSGFTSYRAITANSTYFYHGGSSGNLVFQTDTGGIDMAVNGGSTPKIRIAANGNVIINNTTDQGYSFQVTGTTLISNYIYFLNNIYFGRSDIVIGTGNTNAAAIRSGSTLNFAPNNTWMSTITDAGMSIGTSSNPNASSILDLTSTSKGFLPPRMTNAQRTAISSPAVGLIVYCTDATEGLYVYKSGGWTFII